MKTLYKPILIIFAIYIVAIVFARNSSNNAIYWWPIIGGAKYVEQPRQFLISKNICSNYQFIIYPHARLPYVRVPQKFHKHKVLMSNYIIPKNGQLKFPLFQKRIPLEAINAFSIEPNGVILSHYGSVNWLEAVDQSGELYLVENQDWTLCDNLTK